MNTKEFMVACEKDRRGPRPEENNMSIPDRVAAELMGRPWRDEQTGSVSKTLISEQTFRSKTHELAIEDDMIRVTIEMKRNVWREWKRLLIQKGMKQNDPN